MQREPFPSILEETLGEYWTKMLGQNVGIRWSDGRAVSGRQKWLVNSKLNSIFTPDIDQRLFEPIRREFSYSMSALQRPWQRLYVKVALSRWGASLFSGATLAVQPFIPGSQHYLVIPGSYKIRLIDGKTNSAYCLLKSGFDSIFFRREVDARLLAESLELPVPRLIAIDIEAGFVREELVVGTPLNRLGNPILESQAINKVSIYLSQLYAATRRPSTLADYLCKISQQIEVTLPKLPDQSQASRIFKTVYRLKDFINREEQQIELARSHGDVQPANILVDGERIWLIDWEYSAERQIGYDQLVFTLRSRQPVGLRTRLAGYLTQNGETSSQEGRLRTVSIFLLEELLLRIEESAQPRFTRNCDALMILVGEAEVWCDEYCR